MIERVGPKAPLSLRPPALPALFVAPPAARAGSVMEGPLGEIAGDLRPITRASRRAASYELLVSNDTPQPVATFAYATSANQRRDRITWNAILVPPYSAIAVEIDVALPGRGRLPHVVAELHSDDAKLTLDGGPPHRYARGFATRATLAATALLMLTLGTASVARTQAHVEALGAPGTVRAGTPFTVAYAARHTLATDYTVDTAEGVEVSRGSLRDGAGSFTVALPDTNVSTGYDIRVFAHGRFGTDVGVAHVVALAGSAQRSAAHELRVDHLGLVAETVRGGDAIAVDYHTSAKAGYVRLIDEIGTVRAEALLSPHGHSVLQAPYVDSDQDMRVVVDAQDGAARAESETPVRLLRSDPGIVNAMPGRDAMVVPALGPDAADPSDPNARGADDAASATAEAPVASGGTVPVADLGGGDDRGVASVHGDGVIAVAPVQRLGASIVVRVMHDEPGLRIALMGTSGDEIEGVDLQPGDMRAILPAVTGRPQHLSVVATYAKGFGQETFIRPITLR